jgi:MFS family permease
MESENQPTNLNKFLIIWIGQLASVLGSEMTNFAITLWAWELTNQATPLSLIIFFTHIPKVIAASFAGLFVDRWNRKYLMMLGDTAAGFSTVAILLLLLTNHLQIWHFYVTGAINGFFGYVQSLAYSASMSAIVPKQHYTRATAMSSYITYSGSSIIAPALAGALYYTIGFQGILTIDIITFAIAISTLWFIAIPQPQKSQESPHSQNIKQELTFGFSYILKRPSLLTILIFLLSSNLFDTANGAIHSPMILARSGDNAGVLASVQAAIGIGGVVGAVVLSIWGISQHRIHGLLLGTALSFSGMMVLGLGNLPSIWMIAGFFMAFFSPFIGSSNQAIWLSKVEPNVQGRVFATRYLIAQITAPLGLAIAGLLADYVFEPAMVPGGFLAGSLGSIFGTASGSGMALQYTLFSFCGLLIGLGGYAFPALRDVETIVPDCDRATEPNP